MKDTERLRVAQQAIGNARDYITDLAREMDSFDGRDREQSKAEIRNLFFLAMTQLRGADACITCVVADSANEVEGANATAN